MPRSGKPAGRSARSLLIVGGREDKEGPCEILRYLAERAGSGKLVIATLAGEEPAEQWKTYSQLFSRFGVKKLVRMDFATREEVMAHANPDLLAGASAVYFTGGDQLKLTSKLAGTPVFSRIVELMEAGVLIAGTSAGAAAMSETMLVGHAKESHKVGSAYRVGAGLGLVKDIIIDQHFAQRWRIGRLLGAVAEKPSSLGIGIDEDTAIAVQGNRLRVIGSGAVYIVDGSGVTYTNMSEEEYDRTMAIFDVRLHVLKPGNCFDLESRRPWTEEQPRAKKGGADA